MAARRLSSRAPAFTYPDIDTSHFACVARPPTILQADGTFLGLGPAVPPAFGASPELSQSLLKEAAFERDPSRQRWSPPAPVMVQDVFAHPQCLNSARCLLPITQAKVHRHSARGNRGPDALCQPCWARAGLDPPCCLGRAAPCRYLHALCTDVSHLGHASRACLSTNGW